MNTTKPGLPGYTGPDAGMALWVHHGVPVEYCTSFTERIAYIVDRKPPWEHALRLHALTYIGADTRTEAYVTAWKAAVTARKAYVTARKAAVTARKAAVTACKAYVTARKAAVTACKAYDTACKAYDTAWKAAVTARKAAVTACKAYDTARKAMSWRELAQDYAPEVPYFENGELDFETYNARKGA